MIGSMVIRQLILAVCYRRRAALRFKNVSLP
jgi:hypothetical protein